MLLLLVTTLSLTLTVNFFYLLKNLLLTAADTCNTSRSVWLLFSPLSSFCTTLPRGELLSIAAQPHCRICRCNLFFLSFGASSVNDHHCFFFSFFFNCCPSPLVGNCQLHYTATTTAQMLHNQLRRKCVCVCVCVLFKVCCCCFGREVKVALQSLALSSMGATFF